jgi:cytochrome b6-f complex iron-sulfur subunit
MANISDLSGDERAQRIAELKRKMQESASQKKAAAEAPQAAETAAEQASAAAAQESPADSKASTPEAAEAVAETAAPAEAVADEAVAEGRAEPAVAESAVAEPAAEVAAEVAPVGNGAVAPATLAASTALPTAKVEIDPELALRKEMNRREFLTYTWGAALGLLLLQGGVASFLFMYPRFKEGEFGGKFRVGDVSTMPPSTEPPQAWVDGKFWLVSTEADEPKALYMVCTHLGCLYKWVAENFRFECPCHGSKFSHDGFYIEGPASRSLDYFDVDIAESGEVSVNTGAKTQGGPAIESPAREI